MEMNTKKTYERSEELLKQINKLTKFFIKTANDDICVEVVLIEVASNYLLNAYESLLNSLEDQSIRNEALEKLKKILNSQIDELKYKKTRR